MAAARRLRLVIEWDDDGTPDYVDGEESGYLAFVNGLSSLGAEVIDETTV